MENDFDDIYNVCMCMYVYVCVCMYVCRLLRTRCSSTPWTTFSFPPSGLWTSRWSSHIARYIHTYFHTWSIHIRTYILTCPSISGGGRPAAQQEGAVRPPAHRRGALSAVNWKIQSTCTYIHYIHNTHAYIQSLYT